ncbi:2-oxoacid:acceptor oxidoreductase subunit alpha [Deferribacter autotrophicus]|uniref:2-oxoacid:acceptor oxidoreductase subunit alpha n=1 Tax=Deferribacter autotrophicus TaxID=500465 RepID=A0A5A8F5U4_9BACT|nr:2-oxoacid:acceptor oxidoreductase subunit alpha [Deferribacter autotrophicus]KAA0259494.1 2-oxoacid:acceptor oxidoreductase subunit alpha [Deferribacter autotrophicus]
MSMLKIKIAAPAGFGIMSMGPLLAKVLKRYGFYVMGYPEYPSLIRGGYNSYLLMISDEPVYSPYEKTDILLTYSKLSFDKEDLKSDTIVIADFEKLRVDKSNLNCKVYDIPFAKTVKEEGLPDIVQNIIGIAYLCKGMGIDISVLKEVLKGALSDKVLEVNYKAAECGYRLCTEHFVNVEWEKRDLNEHIIMTGNEVAATSAITAGVNFYSTYPMTPASTVLHFLAKYAKDYNIIVKHTEDEIAGITMAIGAAYAGARAMTGTSGGGFSLMVEGLGLAAITETPLVLFISQRPGPATGMPTWQEQADLRFVLHASQDEFVRAVFTPGDLKELFYAVFDAFNIAEKYQIPVFVLSDKYLSESIFMEDGFKTEGLKIDRGYIFEGDKSDPMNLFPRYKEYKDGIPKRAFPGTPGGIHKTPSNEHDEYGFVSDDAFIRKEQQERRFRKLENLVKEMPTPLLYGDETADITFVSWGSTKTVLFEAMKYEKNFNFIHFPSIYPIDWKSTKGLLETRKKLILIENNFTGQLGGIIAENTGVFIEDKFLKYDGRPFFVEEVLNILKRVS